MGKTRNFKLFCLILIASTSLCSSAATLPKQQLNQNEGNLNHFKKVSPLRLDYIDFLILERAQKEILCFVKICMFVLDCSEGIEGDCEKIGEKRLGF